MKYGGVLSSEFIATSGVPQGSTLGPIFFNILINDAPAHLNDSSNCLLYADDIKLFKIIKTQDDCDFLQEELNVLVEWSTDNCLSFNINKCKVVHYSRGRAPRDYTYHVNNSALERVSQFKDLGVVFDSKFTFNEHRARLIGDSYRLLGFVKRNTKFFTVGTTISLYNAIVRSKLEYAAIIWSPYYQIHVSDVEKVQKRFLRYLFLKSHHIYPDYNIRTCDMLREFQMLSLEARRSMSQVLFVFKLLKGYIDDGFLLSLLHINVPLARLRARHLMFRIPHVHTVRQLYSPTTYMMVSCNKYCEQLEFSDSLARFTRSLLNILECV